MKWVTIKMVGITSLFLVTIAPFCIAFTHALVVFIIIITTIITITTININFQVVTPKSTFLFDVTFPLSLFNGPLQPVIYILAFSKLRRAFWELFCPLAKNRSLNTAVDAPVRVTMVTMEMKPSCRLIDIREMASINNWSRGIEWRCEKLCQKIIFVGPLYISCNTGLWWIKSITFIHVHWRNKIEYWKILIIILITPIIYETYIECCLIFLCCDEENDLHDCLRDNVEQPPICRGNCSTSTNIDKKLWNGWKTYFSSSFLLRWLCKPLWTITCFMLCFQWWEDPGSFVVWCRWSMTFL